MSEDTSKLTPQKCARKNRADHRKDFMKRIFAVAVSVGFAAPLTRMDWIVRDTIPTPDERHQLAVLLTALVATVGSWEGYFTALDDRPLFGISRFLIDIALVFVYMFLLITSNHPTFLLPILTGIFALYVLWDALTIFEHPSYYYYGDTQKIPPRYVILKTYASAIGERGSPLTRRGHIITLIWAVYFLGLLILNAALRPENIYATCVFAFVGLISYRFTKRTRYDDGGTEMRRSSRDIFLILAWVVFVFLTALVWAFLNL